jgi:hypothetical protein
MLQDGIDLELWYAVPGVAGWGHELVSSEPEHVGWRNAVATASTGRVVASHIEDDSVYSSSGFAWQGDRNVWTAERTTTWSNDVRHALGTGHWAPPLYLDTSVAFDSQDLAHVATVETVIPAAGGGASVLRYYHETSPGTWAAGETVLGSAVDNVAAPCDLYGRAQIALDAADRPHIVYTCVLNIECSYRYVWFDGSDWVDEAVAGFYDDASFVLTACILSDVRPSIALTEADVPHVTMARFLWNATTLGYEASMDHGWREGIGWQRESIETHPSDTYHDSSLAFDGDDHPHAAWHVLPSQAIHTGRDLGAGWEVEPHVDGIFPLHSLGDLTVEGTAGRSNR